MRGWPQKGCVEVQAWRATDVDLGQHLLIDDAVIARVLKGAALKPGDRVLDAGAGRGALTAPMATAVAPGKVYAVDVDNAMLKVLAKKALPGVEVEEGDLLTWHLPELDAVAANPPFKIAAPFLERVAHVPRGVYVVPRELAERLLAKPGSKEYGILTIRIGLRASVDDLGLVSRKAFDPPPAVTCGIIRLRGRDIGYDPEILAAVLDAARGAWNRKSKHAFAPLAHQFRTDGAALASLLKETGWGEQKTSTLAPYMFGAVVQHLMAGRKAAS